MNLPPRKRLTRSISTISRWLKGTSRTRSVEVLEEMEDGSQVLIFRRMQIGVDRLSSGT